MEALLYVADEYPGVVLRAVLRVASRERRDELRDADPAQQAEPRVAEKLVPLAVVRKRRAAQEWLLQELARAQGR